MIEPMNAGQIRDHMPSIPDPMARAVLVVLSGLPGTGKSHFARHLCLELPFAIVETDFIRKTLFHKPTYSGKESATLFSTCHILIEKMLEERIPVILDATNLIAFRREKLSNIALKTGAKLILVQVQAPPDLVCKRLSERLAGHDPYTNSDADWHIYKKMSRHVDPIRENHFTVDTSKDIRPVIAKIVKQVSLWAKI